ncbi:hypothetical protein HFN49_31765 [Rhizobium leguminosarum]|uniref:hypothetical protein n=1 Tax=Rhizobium ruizarguesonis TaxID=2081791 RepID=UPI001A991D98|nr:hypothetical protein [Rhizobium ruizarguesonis]MBY5890755.1 hypothetical protein [Rhizobium leguminosarum]QSZ05119.1 hypothetical protein J3P73_31405 [Rhizobium ruizarguesonis]
MTAVVTLDVFSGAPNPTWELSDHEINQLRQLIGSLQEKSLLKPPAVAGRLGYVGFRIDSALESLYPTIVISEGVVDVARLVPSRIDRDRKIERFLLDTARRLLKPDIIAHVERKLQIPNKFTAGPNMHILSPVPYDPGKWNDDPTIQTTNNCYNYANDIITNTIAQPGRGTGLIYSAFECGNVGIASTRDGLVASGRPASTPIAGHYVALVIWPSYDYHWYRLDDDSFWSHKRGQFPAKNVDESGNPISDPENCDRADYSIFCGYYLSDPSTVTIA